MSQTVQRWRRHRDAALAVVERAKHAGDSPHPLGVQLSGKIFDSCMAYTAMTDAERQSIEADMATFKEITTPWV